MYPAQTSAPQRSHADVARLMKLDIETVKKICGDAEAEDNKTDNDKFNKSAAHFNSRRDHSIERNSAILQTLGNTITQALSPEKPVQPVNITYFTFSEEQWKGIRD